MLLRAPQILVLLAVLGVSGCAQVKPADEFAFQTEEERLDALAVADTDTVDAAAGDTTDASDVVEPDVVDADVADAPDVADGADVPDVADVADASDTSDALDVADAPDSADTADVADVLDTAAIDDAPDMVDVADSQDVLDVADAPDAVDLCTGVTCDDGDPCTDDSCLPASGCNHSPGNGGTCSPDPCHSAGTCVDGTCKFAAAISCDDTNDCTVDACDASTGCSHVALNNGGCVGDLCFTSQTCKAGVCQGGAAKVCTDSAICTDDSCDPVKGCVFLPNSATCDDGAACTGADVCAGGKCAGVSKFVDATFAGVVSAQKVLALADGFVLAGNASTTSPWLARTDAVGAPLWQQTYGAAIGVTDLAADANGYVLAGAQTAGSNGAVLLQTDANGLLQWQQTFPSGVGGNAPALAVGADGIGLAFTLATGAASTDGRLVHVDLSGGATWTVSFGGAQADSLHAIAGLADGFALAGGTSSAGAGGSDFWLVRTDATGSELWQKTYGGSGEDAAHAVLALSDGYLLAGQTTSKGAGGADAWLVRTDLNGNKLWDKTYGGKQPDSALQVLAVPGGYAFSGTTASTGAGGNEMWLVRIDNFGNKFWGFPYGGTGDDGGSRVALLPDGYALAGYTGSKGAGQQAWLLRLDLFGNTTCAASGACIGKLASDCTDGNPCTSDLCDATHSGCWHGAPATFACDDGLKCTGPDVCTSNVCGGPALNCDDNNVCTADSCDAEFGCVNEALDSGTCGADSCHTAGVCGSGTCNGSLAISCDDGKPCTDDSCDVASGCLHSSNDKNTCSDGKICTIGDHCSAGTCTGTADTCDDGNVCTADFCDPSSGCMHGNNNAVACNSDGCLFGQVCVGGTCGGGTPKNCDDSNACTTDFCASGNCAHGFLPNFTPCSTGTACVAGETCTGGVCGGGGPKEFDATYGGSGLDNGYGITALSDGFAFVGSGPDVSSGTWVVRTDLKGKAIWNKTYPVFGGGSTQGNAIAGLSDGLIVCGQANVAGGDGTDARLIRLDNNGGIIWDHAVGNINTENCAAVVALADGSFAFTGSQVGSGGEDVFSGRWTGDGTLLWATPFGGSGNQSAYGIASISTGLAFAGSNNAKGAGGADFWLAATDLNGNALWDQTYGTASDDAANAIVALPDGYALAGRTGTYDFYLVRTDLNGVKLWDRTYATATTDIAYGLVALGDGFALTGSTGSSGAENYWLVRTDAQGNKIWDKKYGGSGSDSGYGIAALSDGFALIGSSDSKGAGLLDAWLIRTDSYGNASCSASGACDGMNEFGCDDGNSCTADFCSSGLCGHVSLTDGAGCDDGNSCTSGDACSTGSCAGTSPTPNFCAASASCWAKDTDCTTVTKCGGSSWQGCPTGHSGHCSATTLFCCAVDSTFCSTVAAPAGCYTCATGTIDCATGTCP